MPKQIEDMTEEESDEVCNNTILVNGASYELEVAPHEYDAVLEAVGPWLKKARKIDKAK
ncbi:Lsr2 family protein [Streptomyces melanogenes]|uniref:Lsr2 family protein n=1 Tax=Streptomyces melanogenes TaxID=67326 RepID=UPI00167EFCCC|nr:Lsr2 family protein [Streptomyces melanogenes]GGP88264.1 hypothetical protein GCM10010278_78480 [Streptomyces melanogenes]